MIGKGEIFRSIEVTLFVHLLLMHETFSENSAENSDKQYEVIQYSPVYRSTLSLSWFNTTIEIDQNLDGVLCGTNMIYKLKHEKVLESGRNIKTYFCECGEGFIETFKFCIKPLIEEAESMKIINKLNKEEIGYCELQGTVCGKNMVYYIISFLNVKTDYGYLCRLRCFCRIQYVQVGATCESNANCHGYIVFQQKNITSTIYADNSCYNLVDQCCYNSMLLLRSQVIFDDRIQCNIICMCAPGYKMEPFECMKNTGTTIKSIENIIVARRNPDNHNLAEDIQTTKDPSKPPQLLSIRGTLVDDCIWENESCGKNMVLTLEEKIINIPRFSIQCRYRCLCSPGYTLESMECINENTTIVRRNPDQHNLAEDIQTTKDPSKLPQLPSIRRTLVDDCIWENENCGKNMVLTLEEKIINIPRFSIQCRYRCLCSPGYTLVSMECINENTTIARKNPDQPNLAEHIQTTKDPSKPPQLPSIRRTLVDDCIWENESCGKNMVLTLEEKIINIVSFSIQCRYRCLCSPGYKLVSLECIKGKVI